MKTNLTRKWKIVLLHHTHLDIGYTHTQDEVLQIQFGHLNTAMDIIEANKHRQNTARFRWNPEILWAIDEWIQQTKPADLDRFVHLVQEGYIGLDGLYGNVLTGLCRPEELMASFQIKQQLERLTRTPIDSAMITDIPGWNWGLVTALAENGVRYLSCGPNRGDRIGYILKDWGDKPFYWVSPSRKEKILVYVHGQGYSWFHTGMHNEKNLSRKLNPMRVLRYLRKLERKHYPYDTVIIRYNIGADNGPPDPHLSQIVESWNAQYPEMELEISTTTKAMADFVQVYGEHIPEFCGDLTPYWEDGAASTARETAIAREAGERITQASLLAAWSKQGQFNTSLLHAWKQTFLYNEHTWGAYNSISRPDHPFAKSQWEWKKQRAMVANYAAHHNLEKIAGSLLFYPLSYPDSLQQKKKEMDGKEVLVVNTHSWPVSQVISIATPYNHLTDDLGHPVGCQRLHNGTLAFIAKDVPPLSVKKYFLEKTDTEQTYPGMFSDPYTLKNHHIEVVIDEKWGTIKQILYEGADFVKQSERERFNQYVFAQAKWGQKIILNRPENVDIEVLDNGPIISTVQISKSGFRTQKITTTISITALSARIFIENRLNRPVSRKKEGIYFQFPFDLDDGRVKYDTIFGSAMVDQDQLPGANRNFITATRWVDISDHNYGISCALLDAPLFKSGPLVHDPIRVGSPKLCGWLRQTDYTGTIYSYVMNNYWMTNYKADQPGITLFRYVFLPHAAFREDITNRFALEESQPLLVFGNSPTLETNLETLPFSVLSSEICLHSLVHAEGSYIVRLYNLADSPKKCEIQLQKNFTLELVSPNKQQNLENSVLKFAPHETMQIIIKNQE